MATSPPHLERKIVPPRPYARASAGAIARQADRRPFGNQNPQLPAMASRTELLQFPPRGKRLRIEVCQRHQDVGAIAPDGPDKTESHAGGIGCIPELSAHAIPRNLESSWAIHEPLE
jgi:hypothetical protein